MAACKLCGEPAGFLRRHHKDCSAKRKVALRKIPEFVTRAFQEPIDLQSLRSLTDELARTHFVSGQEYERLVKRSLQQIIDRALADRLLTGDEAERIHGIQAAFGAEELDLGDAGRRLWKATTLRMIELGSVPEPRPELYSFPVNFEARETPIYAFGLARYYTQRTKTTYRGQSQGVSIRLMKGVYYRVGASAVKIPGRKIVSLQAFADGFTIVRDSVNPKPEVFKFEKPKEIDTAFAVNLISRVNQIGA